MFLSEVVEASSAPIAEEQAWGLYYQGLKTLKAENQSNAFSGPTNEGISLDSIFLHKDGLVSFRRDTSNKSDQPKSKKMKYSEAAVLYDLGSSVYSALDYGISADEERVLGPPLENLISMMITDYLDEGLGEENYSGLSKIDSIMKICKEHVPRAINADIFYQNIVREMVTEMTQLSLAGHALVDHGGSSSGSTADPRVVQKWSKVTEEIKGGQSKLKKADVAGIGANVRACVMSPHETLMFAIRNQKQQLRAVKVPRVHPRLTSAHDATLQLIRSRPKLRPVVERHLNPTPPRRYSVRELIHMELLDRAAGWPSSEPRYRTPRTGRLSGGRSSSRLLSASTGRRRLKIDPQLLACSASEEFGSATRSMGSGWRYPEMQCTTDDIDWRSYDVGSAGLLGKRRLSFSDPDLSRRRLSDEGDPETRGDSHVNLEEVLHIRETLVRAELDRIEVDDQRLHADLISGKACFSCKKKFGFFGNKGLACDFCERMVCPSCVNSTVVFSKPSVRAQVEGLGPRFSFNPRDCHVVAMTPTQSKIIADDEEITNTFMVPPAQESSVGVRVCTECSSLLKSFGKV